MSRRQAGVAGGKGGRGFPVRFATVGEGGGGGGAVTVTGVTPAWGAPNDSVVIAGTNFTDGQAVLLGGVACTVTNVTSTATTITVPSSGVFTAGNAYDISVAGVTLAGAFRWFSVAPLFQSDFSNSTGADAASVRDGTKWHADVYNPSGYLTVVTASSASIDDDWPTANALRVERSSSATARAWTSLDGVWSVPSVGNSLYFRDFVRCAMTTSNAANENSHHPTEAAYIASGGSVTTLNPYVWKMVPIGSSQFQMALWFSAVNADYNIRLLKSDGTRLAFNIGETYRREWKLTRQGANSYTAEVRVYDNTGALYGNSGGYGWRSNFGSHTLLTALGPYTIGDTRVGQLRTGSNGGGFVNASAEYFYVGGFMVRSDTWCGAY